MELALEYNPDVLLQDLEMNMDAGDQATAAHKSHFILAGLNLYTFNNSVLAELDRMNEEDVEKANNKNPADIDKSILHAIDHIPPVLSTTAKLTSEKEHNYSREDNPIVEEAFTYTSVKLSEAISHIPTVITITDAIAEEMQFIPTTADIAPITEKFFKVSTASVTDLVAHIPAITMIALGITDEMSTTSTDNIETSSHKKTTIDPSVNISDTIAQVSTISLISDKLNAQMSGREKNSTDTSLQERKIVTPDKEHTAHELHSDNSKIIDFSSDSPIKHKTEMEESNFLKWLKSIPASHDKPLSHDSGTDDNEVISTYETIKVKPEQDSKGKDKYQVQEEAPPSPSPEKEETSMDDEGSEEKNKDLPNGKSEKSLKHVIENSVSLGNEIASETLASLLAHHGHIDRAREMYKKLSLLFPNKSSYFAEQIKKLDIN